MFKGIEWLVVKTTQKVIKTKLNIIYDYLVNNIYTVHTVITYGSDNGSDLRIKVNKYIILT